MKIIKRNGAEVPFDITKIITAVTKASDSVGGKARLSREQITDIAAAVTDQCQALNRAVSVEEVQDMVENQLMDIKAAQCHQRRLSGTGIFRPHSVEVSHRLCG